jgi:pimeloyl-ACP methyl ester carboxylesterase
VDNRSVVVCGYAQGGALALLAAAREKQIDAIVTIASPGGTGAEVLLEQQQQVLAGMNIPDAEKQAKIDLQKKIQQAVISGSGWEGVPDNLRRQADTPLFKSQLSFDPAEVLGKTRQPMLIVQGDADAQVAPASAERLASIARGRKKAGVVEVVHVPGMTHGMVEGNERAVSSKLAPAIADWIKKTL